MLLGPRRSGCHPLTAPCSACYALHYKSEAKRFSLLEVRNIQTKWYISAGALILGALFLTTAYRVHFAESVYKDKSNDSQIVELACSLLPSFWQVCLEAAHFNIENGDFIRAEKKLENILSIQPYHYPAIKMQAFLANKKENRLDECLSLWAYDSILNNTSSLHSTKIDSCGTEFLKDISHSSVVTSLGILAKATDSKERLSPIALKEHK